MRKLGLFGEKELEARMLLEAELGLEAPSWEESKLKLIPNSFWNVKEMLTFSLDVNGSKVKSQRVWVTYHFTRCCVAFRLEQCCYMTPPIQTHFFIHQMSVG
ncbi:hypothetical protein CapIbe_005440 [Capra ibex]